MRLLIINMIGMSAAAVAIAWQGRAAPNAEEIVSRPRTQVYAQLDTLYSALERKTATVQTVTGSPEAPVTFTYEREPGEMLSLRAKAGMRTVHLTTWLEDGPAAGQTRVKVLFEPHSIRKCSGEATVLAAVERTLWQAELQAVDGQRVSALFGDPKKITC